MPSLGRESPQHSLYFSSAHFIILTRRRLSANPEFLISESDTGPFKTQHSYDYVLFKPLSYNRNETLGIFSTYHRCVCFLPFYRYIYVHIAYFYFKHQICNELTNDLRRSETMDDEKWTTTQKLMDVFLFITFTTVDSHFRFFINLCWFELKNHQSRFLKCFCLVFGFRTFPMLFYMLKDEVNH